MQEQLDWRSDDLDLPCIDCYRCHSIQPGCQLTTCISAHVYLELERGMFSQEIDPVTLQPAPKELLVSKSLRDQLAREHCGHKFHQVCEGRRREAAYDNLLFDVSHTARGEIVHTPRDLKHRLCETCLKVVQPDSLETRYTGQLPGMLKDL